MQISVGTTEIAKRAAEVIGEMLILSYGTNEGEVVLGATNPSKPIGISAPNGEYAKPSAYGVLHTQVGMTVDVIVGGIAIVFFGAETVAYGDPVKADAQGRAVKANAGDWAIGICDCPMPENCHGRVKIQIHKV